jgi:hypothetical protein
MNELYERMKAALSEWYENRCDECDHCPFNKPFGPHNLCGYLANAYEFMEGERE